MCRPDKTDRRSLNMNHSKIRFCNTTPNLIIFLIVENILKYCYLAYFLSCIAIKLFSFTVFVFLGNKVLFYYPSRSYLKIAKFNQGSTKKTGTAIFYKFQE